MKPVEFIITETDESRVAHLTTLYYPLGGAPIIWVRSHRLQAVIKNSKIFTQEFIKLPKLPAVSY